MVVGGNPPEIGRVNTWTLKIASADCAPLSVARLVVPPGPFDPGASVALDASTSNSVDGPMTYEWDLGNGTFVSDNHAVVHPTFTQGVHTVRVRVSNAGGIIGIASATVIVSYPPVASIALPSPDPTQNHYVHARRFGLHGPRQRGHRPLRLGCGQRRPVRRRHGRAAQRLLRRGRSHPIHLKVTDVDGATGTATATLNVTATLAPVASITATPAHVAAGEPVVFDAGGSTDDGTIVGYEWDLDGNGTFETVSGSSPSAGRSYPNGAALNVAVRVTDDDDRTTVASVLVTVDAPPGAGGGPTGAGGDPVEIPGGGAGARPGAGTTAAALPRAPAARSAPHWAPRRSRD